MYQKILNDIKVFSSPARARKLAAFFKTGEGEYGEGDLFLGARVPDVRKVVVKVWRDVSLSEAQRLLRSRYHELRLCGLLILIKRYQKIPAEREKIYRGYFANAECINNWDLVDVSAEHIVGAYLAGKSKKPLYELARSKNLWRRRIAVLATFYYIRLGRAEETLKIAKILLGDKHDLIHKAVGWMLREVGKRCSQKALLDFLDQYSTVMPRTMLRYAIEKLPEKRKKYYLGR